MFLCFVDKNVIIFFFVVLVIKNYIRIWGIIIKVDIEFIIIYNLNFMVYFYFIVDWGYGERSKEICL